MPHRCIRRRVLLCDGKDDTVGNNLLGSGRGKMKDLAGNLQRLRRKASCLSMQCCEGLVRLTLEASLFR